MSLAFWLIPLLAGLILTLAIVLRPSKKMKPPPKELEQKIIEAPVREIIRYIREQVPTIVEPLVVPTTSEVETSTPEEETEEDTKNAKIEQVIFIGTPTQNTKDWVRTLPIAAQPRVIRLDAMQPEEVDKRPIMAHLTAMAHVDHAAVALIVDTKHCTFDANTVVELPTDWENQACLISKKPLIYTISRRQYRQWTEALVSMYQKGIFEIETALAWNLVVGL